MQKLPTLFVAIVALTACRQIGAGQPVRERPLRSLLAEQNAPAPAATAPAAASVAQVSPQIQQVAAQPWHKSAQGLLPWGAAPGQAGRALPSEANPEAPSSLAVTADGRIWLLDQVNARVTVFRLNNGQVTDVEPDRPATRTTQDLAVAPDGSRLWLLDRLVQKTLTRVDLATGLASVLPLGHLPASQLAGMNALFERDDGVWAEIEHSQLLHLATLDASLPTPQLQLGRAAGKLVVRAQKAQKNTVMLVAYADVQVGDQGAIPPATWVRTLTFAQDVLHIAGVDPLPDGSLWVTVELATFREGQAPLLAREAVLVGAQGQEIQRIHPCLAEGPEEQLRTTATGADGALYQMCRSDAGLHVERWSR